MNQKIFQIREDLDKYSVFRKCRFYLKEKGLFIHCPSASVNEIYKYRYVVLDCALRLGIAGFVILTVGKNRRFAGVKITPENFIALKRFALEMLYRAT